MPNRPQAVVWTNDGLVYWCLYMSLDIKELTHWGRHQAIIWTSAGILFVGPLETYFNKVLIKMQQFSFKKMCLKMLSAKSILSRPQWVKQQGNFVLFEDLGLLDMNALWWLVRGWVRGSRLLVKILKFTEFNVSRPFSVFVWHCIELITGS